MEQNLVSHHSSVRNYRAKGKRVSQVLSLLAICMWLLYQIKNSNQERENYPQNPSERNITIVLGRKGIMEYMNGATAESQDKSAPEEFERREDGGVGDDELDVNIDEDVENVFIVAQEAGMLNERNEATSLKRNKYLWLTLQTNIVNDSGESVHRAEAFLDENGIPPDASNVFFNSTSDGAERKHLD